MAGVTTKGLLSVASGIFMGLFYRFVAAAMYADAALAQVGKMGPYAAVFIFAIGVLLSSFLWNTMKRRRRSGSLPIIFVAASIPI